MFAVFLFFCVKMNNRVGEGLRSREDHGNFSRLRIWKLSITTQHPVSPTFLFDLLIVSFLTLERSPTTNSSLLLNEDKLSANDLRVACDIAVTSSLLKCRSKVSCLAIYLRSLNNPNSLLTHSLHSANDDILINSSVLLGGSKTCKLNRPFCLIEATKIFLEPFWWIIGGVNPRCGS